tara:strand:- start:574 stop:897 length:324 start_codon:yes stop_codon:yes gene_type:complete
MKNDDRIQILTESGGNWTGTWAQLLMHNPFWLSKMHPAHLSDLENMLNQGQAYNGGGDGRERFFVFKKGLEVSDFPSIKKYTGRSTSSSINNNQAKRNHMVMVNKGE